MIIRLDENLDFIPRERRPRTEQEVLKQERREAEKERQLDRRSKRRDKRSQAY